MPDSKHLTQFNLCPYTSVYLQNQTLTVTLISNILNLIYDILGMQHKMIYLCLRYIFLNLDY